MRGDFFLPLMLSPNQIYLLFPVCGAVCGALLWINFFQKIDILEPERLRDVMLAFCIGFLTPTIALWTYRGLDSIGFDFNGDLFNDLMYSIFGVGLTEELSKLLGVGIAFFLLKKRINEPIDYLIFGGIVALGFSIRENFIYYSNYGSLVITGRTLISCLVHIINTSICVYGIYRFKIFQKGNSYLNSIIGISIAVASHGLFDFFLTHQIIGFFTPFLATIVYLIGVNFWIQMFNNAINYSPFFNYTKLFSTTKLYQTILLWYGVTVVIEFAYANFYNGFDIAVSKTLANIFKEGILLTIVALRTSRLKISKRKYFPVKIQSPIYITRNGDEDYKILGIPLKIRGENEKEFRFLEYMAKDIQVCPTSKQNSIFKGNQKARLLKKYFLKNDVVAYLIEIYYQDETPNQIYLLKPKTSGITIFSGLYPIGTLMNYDNPSAFQKSQNNLSIKDLKKIEEVYLKVL